MPPYLDGLTLGSVRSAGAGTDGQTSDALKNATMHDTLRVFGPSPCGASTARPADAAELASGLSQASLQLVAADTGRPHLTEGLVESGEGPGIQVLSVV
jgi:hypothetical protein